MPLRLSLRARLLLASAFVQTVMLGLIVGHSTQLMNKQLAERARLHLEEQKQLFSAALAAPLQRGDRAGIRAILERVRRDGGIAYLLLYDERERIIASSGWYGQDEMPRLQGSITDPGAIEKGWFDAETTVDAGSGNTARLRFGTPTAFIQAARAELIRDNLLIGVVALLVSLVSMIAIAFWLTRSVTRLTRASESLAAGDLTQRLPVEGGDEVGRLTQAFNTMANVLQGRIKALAESEAKFSAIADYSYDCELWISPEGRLIWINPRVFDMFGYTPEECLNTPNFPAPFLSEPDVGRTVRQIRRALRGNSGADYEFRARRKDGAEFWAAADWRPIYDGRGGYLGIRISIRDINQRKEAERRLESTVVELRDAQAVQQQYLTRARDEHARLSALLGAMDVGILFVSPDNKVVYSNPAFTRIWAVAPGTRVIGRDPEAILAGAAGALARPEEQLKRILRAPRAGEILGTLEISMADGRLVTQQVHSVEDVYGRPVGHLWLFEDITRARQTADQLIYLAERDPLTGLYNRHRFNEELARMSADAERHASQVALLFFDLDEFKYINDTFGHRAGDAMLIRVAGEVAGQVRRNEILARLGGDEFAILVPDISDDMLRVLAERITQAIANVRFEFEGHSLRLTTSLGIAILPDHADNAEDLIARADTAMYQAKEAGKNAWRIYRSDIDTTRQMVTRLSWNDRILHALENDLMDVQFQGVYATSDRALSHFEVLVRMRDKDERSRHILPAQFIPPAEKSGKVLDIDRWVLRESVRMLADVQSIPALAVNISGRSFNEPMLPQYIAGLLKHHGVAPRRLLVELTETSAVSDLHEAQRFIDALHQTGCGVSLDDFGTGFSSFAYLKHLQVDSVKIDGLFIRNLANDADNQLFVKAMVTVARGMHKTIIAECVEDEETLSMLKSFEVDCVQGFYLERPRTDLPWLMATSRLKNTDMAVRFT